MKMNTLAATLVEPGAADEQVHEELSAFEHGELIRQDLFERLVGVLGVDIDEARRLIAQQRVKEEERWQRDYLDLPDRLSISSALRPTVGWTCLLPSGLSEGEAEAFAARVARERGAPLTMHLRGTRTRFDREGRTTERTVLAGWSSYPFSAKFSHTKVDDAWG